MRSWILTLALAALMLNVAFTLPVELDETEHNQVSDEELLKVLEGHSQEIDADSSALTRRRRAVDSNSSSAEENKDQKAKKDGDPNDTSSASTEEKTEEPAARRKRATPENKSIEELLGILETHSEAEAHEIHGENSEDYAQGCEVLEVNSKEVNNETFLE